MNADSFTVADDSYMPTGEIRAVEGTTMDLRTEHAIIDGLDREFDQVANANGGYDHNWCLNTKGDDTQVAATLYSPKTGIFMEMFTNEPGVQVYTTWFASMASTILSTSLYVWRARSIPTAPTILNGPVPY